MTTDKETLGRILFSTPSADRLVAVFYVIDDVIATLRSEQSLSQKRVWSGIQP